MRIDQIAELCHEANRGYCAALGDESHLPWAGEPEWKRQSVIKGVLFVLNNPGLGAAAAHDAWQADKVRDGWTYGREKNAITKTHPCILPYDELPLHDRAKDHIFIAIVNACRQHMP